MTRCTWLRSCANRATRVVHSAVGTHPVCDDCYARIVARARAQV